jgi:acetoin utilization deacetylase AcuC-like enzyme
MRKRTGLVTDDIYLEHDTGQHPENADRLRVILAELQSDPIWQQLEIIPAEKADRSFIEMVHDPKYIDALEKQIRSGALFIGTMDCIVSAKTFTVAEHAVGGMLVLTRRVAAGELINGFGLVRPPGHHAEARQALGFCYFNNIAICAEYLIRQLNYQRILIMDYDVHHGNGTQHTFESRADVFYCSIHENPAVCYPGTGYQNETGIGAGKGYTLNVPMRSFAGDDDYIEILETTFMPAWREYNPDFVLVSVGFDAHRDDPLARINITEKAYQAYAEALCQIARECCGGKLVAFLEGGYNLGTIPALALLHLRVLAAAADLAV